MLLTVTGCNYISKLFWFNDACWDRYWTSCERICDNVLFCILVVVISDACRIAPSSPPRTERVWIYSKLGWLTINQLVFYHSVLAVYKIRNSKDPQYLANILTKDSRNSRIMIPNVKLQLTQRSFTVRVAASWNHLPYNLKNSAKLGKFKRLAKGWILENVPRFLW